MHRFRSLLVYIDSRPASRAALEAAWALAQRTGARVTVMDVVPEVRPSGLLADAETWTEKLVSARLGELEAQVAALPDAKATCVVSVGKASVELIRQAMRERHDLVVKTARGTEQGRRVYFGSTALHLIRKCPAPVWLVSPKPMGERPRIVAAVDPQSDSGGNSLARRVLDHARGLTAHVGGQLHVVHAWHPAAAGLLRQRVSADELNRYIADVEQSARLALARLLAEAPPTKVEETHHLLRGQPELVIPEFSRNEHINAIVLGSVGRTGIAGLLVGEMAEEILSRVECGVFCIKPDGFVSPVSLGKAPAAASKTARAAGGPAQDQAHG